MKVLKRKRNRYSMESLVGRRYEDLDILKADIENISGRKVNAIIESESDRPEGTDLMIDYEFEPFDIHTMFYLKDMADRYYITEA